MHPREIKTLARLHGVLGVGLVDRDGLLIYKVGDVPDQVPPHAARLLADDFSLGEGVGWSRRDIHAEEWSLMLAPTHAGGLFILADDNANAGMIRLEMKSIIDGLNETFQRSPSLRNTEV